MSSLAPREMALISSPHLVEMIEMCDEKSYRWPLNEAK